MSTITFDTLKFANKLKSAGVLPEHAEAEAEALADIFEANLNEVATKEDIKALKEDIKVLEERLYERFDAKFIHERGTGFATPSQTFCLCCYP
jgi:hypothetical protein